jgi:PAS domain S-box-containing protein
VKFTRGASRRKAAKVRRTAKAQSKNSTTRKGKASRAAAPRSAPRSALSREREAHARTLRRLQAAQEETRARMLECDEIRARYEAALRGAQVHAFSQDRDLRYTWIYNPQEPDAAALMLGHTDDELGSSPEQETAIAAKRKVLATGEPADTEASFITPERRAQFALHIEPVRSASGEIDGVMCAAIDVSRVRSLESERRRLTEELAATAQRYEFALRGSNVAVFTQDRALRYTSVSKPVFGRDAAAIQGKTDADLLPAWSAEAMMAIKNEVLAKGEPRNAELRIEGRGSPLWYDLHLEPMRDVSGSTIGIGGAAVDITERKQNEAHLRLLLRELTHRSKNLLAVIQAMARQTARHGGTVQSFVERFGERVQALSRSHDLLVAESWRSVSLRDLVRSQLAYYIDRGPDLVAIDGPEIKLRPEAAQSLGLALHELAANAARHGAMSKSGGRVDISWQDAAKSGVPRDGFELVWRESGGPKVAAPKRRGFGSMAIEQNLARALDADVSLDFAASGVICRISVPPSQVAGA